MVVMGGDCCYLWRLLWSCAALLWYHDCCSCIGCVCVCACVRVSFFLSLSIYIYLSLLLSFSLSFFLCVCVCVLFNTLTLVLICILTCASDVDVFDVLIIHLVGTWRCRNTLGRRTIKRASFKVRAGDITDIITDDISWSQLYCDALMNLDVCVYWKLHVTIEWKDDERCCFVPRQHLVTIEGERWTLAAGTSDNRQGFMRRLFRLSFLTDQLRKLTTRAVRI